jgi:hypothetical protein
MGHGRPLESPDNSSLRNPQSATRIDEGCRNLTLCPAKGQRGSIQNKSESSPRSPQMGPGSGARRTAAPPREHKTQAMPVMCAWHRRGRLEHCRCRLKRTPRTLVGLAKKPLQEHSRFCKALGDRPAGPLARPHGLASATRGEECPISKRQHLRDPNGYTHRCSGATVEDSHKGPLNNWGKTHVTS